MRKNHAGKPAPKISEKDEIILEATDVFLEAKKYMGIAAIAALNSFTEQLGNNTLSIQAAKKVLDDKALLAEFLVKASQDYADELNRQIRERENKDLAVIKDNTAKKATLITAAAFCVLSPLVTDVEQYPVNWTRTEIQSLFGNVKKNVAQSPFAKKSKETIAPHSDPNVQKTALLQRGESGFNDITITVPSKLDGKEKVTVIVSVASQAVPHFARNRHPHHHRRLKHFIR